ncbi:MAG: hypothetical protein HYV07_12775, partial [Deltaproteobacteria bacterium]|nr:hypothetical protein [Deltaproteobacteria bacterium]
QTSADKARIEDDLLPPQQNPGCLQAKLKFGRILVSGPRWFLASASVAPDLQWTLPGRHPLAGTKRGADEVLAFFHELNKAGVQVDLIRIDNWGNDTVVEVHRGHGEKNGVKLDALNCTHYHVNAAGKIDKVQVYMGDQYGADQFFCAIYEYKPIPDRLA